MLDASVLTLLVRLVVSLGIVLGLMFLAAGFMRKRGIVLGNGGLAKSQANRSAAPQLEILARKGLGRNAQLAVVHAAGKTLVLGITEHQITMLSEAEFHHDLNDVYVTNADGIAIDSLEAQRTALLGSPTQGQFPTWKTFMENVREKTTRK